eukprot:240625-Chlamydomonas_euryale.AAC.2
MNGGQYERVSNKHGCIDVLEAAAFHTCTRHALERNSSIVAVLAAQPVHEKVHLQAAHMRHVMCQECEVVLGKGKGRTERRFWARARADLRGNFKRGQGQYSKAILGEGKGRTQTNKQT